MGLNVNAPKGRQYWKRVNIPWLGVGGMMAAPKVWRRVDCGAKVLFYNPTSDAHGSLEVLVGSASDAVGYEPGTPPVATTDNLPLVMSGGVVLRPGDMVMFPNAPGILWVRPAPGEVSAWVDATVTTPASWSNGVATSGDYYARGGGPIFGNAELILTDDIRFLPSSMLANTTRLTVPALIGSDGSSMVSWGRSLAINTTQAFWGLTQLVPAGTLRRFSRHLLTIQVGSQDKARTAADQRVGTLRVRDSWSEQLYAFGTTADNSTTEQGNVTSVFDVTQHGWGPEVVNGNPGLARGASPQFAYITSPNQRSQIMAWYTLDHGLPVAGGGAGCVPIHGFARITPSALAVNDTVSIWVPSSAASPTTFRGYLSGVAGVPTVQVAAMGGGLYGASISGGGFSTDGTNTVYVAEGHNARSTAFTNTNCTIAGGILGRYLGCAGVLFYNAAVGVTTLSMLEWSVGKGTTA